jgi:hypothetical protein
MPVRISYHQDGSADAWQKDWPATPPATRNGLKRTNGELLEAAGCERRSVACHLTIGRGFSRRLPSSIDRQFHERSVKACARPGGDAVGDDSAREDLLEAPWRHDAQWSIRAVAKILATFLRSFAIAFNATTSSAIEKDVR